jgi:hypothetical protein
VATSAAELATGLALDSVVEVAGELSDALRLSAVNSLDGAAATLMVGFDAGRRSK